MGKLSEKEAIKRTIDNWKPLLSIEDDSQYVMELDLISGSDCYLCIYYKSECFNCIMPNSCFSTEEYDWYGKIIGPLEPKTYSVEESREELKKIINFLEEKLDGYKS